MPAENKQVCIAKPFQGQLTAENIEVKTVPHPEAGEGEVVVKAASLSFDSYLRTRYDTAPAGTAPPDFVIGTVTESRSDKFAVGDLVTGDLPLQLYVAAPADKLTKIDNPLGLPLSNFVGALGMIGQTSFGALEEGGFKPGDVVFVSGAAGVVGSLLGQLARHFGAKKVIGSAGGPEKCKRVVERYGFDACIDYREHSTASAAGEALAAALAGDKIDFYADHTGGHVTDAVWDLMGEDGRVVVVGAIADHKTGSRKIDPFFFKLIYNSVTIRGFITYRWVTRGDNLKRFFDTVPQLVKDGTITIDETVYQGIDKAPEAFAGLFNGTNIGRAVVNV